MATAPLTAAQVLDVLEASPGRIAALTSDVVPAVLVRRPAPEEWSPNEVLAHLRACSDVWGDCIAGITQQGVTTLRAVNPRTWIEQTDYDQQPFHASLAAFAAQRAGLLTLLRSLGPRDWARTATVTGAGAPLTKSALSYGERMARHERPHVRQIERALTALTTADR